MTQQKWQRRVLVVEDSGLLASLIAQALTEAEFEVATARNVQEASELVASFDPDAALLDIDLGPGPTGLDLADRLHNTHPGIAVIILTQFADAMVAGSDTPLPRDCLYLNKGSIADTMELVAAVEAGLAGKCGRWAPPAEQPPPLETLTPAQRQVVVAAARGLTNRAIARERGTSERAVELLLREAALRLGVVAHPDVNARVALVNRYLKVAGQPLTADA